MTFDTAYRIYPAVNLVLADVIASVRERTLRIVGDFITRLDLFPVSMTIGAERFMMARTANLTGGARIEAMLSHKVRSAVIQRRP